MDDVANRKKNKIAVKRRTFNHNLKMAGKSSKKSLTLNDALGAFFATDSECESYEDDEKSNFTVAIQPPTEQGNSDTDKDSDMSDEELEGSLNHLPQIILSTSCEIRNHKGDSSDAGEPNHSLESASSFKKRKISHEVENSIKNIKKNRHWNLEDSFVGEKIPKFKSPFKPTAMDLCHSNIKSPLQSLQKFLSDELIDHILTQSMLYAHKKNLRIELLTKEKILTFIGVLIMSGYNKLPDRKLYWANSPDVHNNLISKSIRRDVFLKIMKSLQLADCIEMDLEDPFYKVRPFFDFLNNAFKICDLPEYLSVDETFVPYYGQYGSKQFTKGKPMNFGFKLWTLASSDGYLFHAEPYGGSSTKLPCTGLGQGPDVVLGLLDKVHAVDGNHIVMNDNFTSIPLLNELSKRGIAGTGTIREDSLENSPLPSNEDLNETPRGTFMYACSEDLVIVKWNDGAAVSVATNKVKVLPCVMTERWSSVEEKKIHIPMPQPLRTYNRHAGGVNLFNQSVSQYGISIHSKKWWWPLFLWGIGAAVVNGWKLYRLMGNDISLLQFTRECSLELLGRFGTPSLGPRKALLIKSTFLEQQRYDRKDHWLCKSNLNHGRCKNCGRRSKYRCEKCNVGLHPECHKAYHIPV